LHESGCHRVVEPGDDALIDLQPFGIVPHGLGIDSAIDMIKKAKLAEGGIEEGTPSGEGAVIIVKGDGHMIVDAHMFHGRDGNSKRCGLVGEGVHEGSGRGGRAGRHGGRGATRVKYARE
jgi:hypothetical protein